MFIGLHVNYTFSCQVYKELEFSLRIFEKYSSIKFHENSPIRSRFGLCEPTNRHMKSLFTILRKHLKIERAYKQRSKEDNLNNVFFQTHNNTTEEFRDIRRSLETKAATDLSRPLPLPSTSSSSFDSRTLHSMLQNTCF